ncbi:ArdC-like ssDNA-binding domain-containing protein [Sphingomonas sp. PP-CE-3G-477]|uniref:ArdC-like ssDNA-binding domain-containing protein n=1 Tax=Sphingomonas sp. PP-CE-3G-477 TaxID=2135660 RepID=UPI00280C3195|nr:ArdC-like ssDNA-binding domain-containing protein [Sphingomonas sp. PP-CE-3G-477]
MSSTLFRPFGCRPPLQRDCRFAPAAHPAIPAPVAVILRSEEMAKDIATKTTGTLYAEVTDRIIAQLEAGRVPWVQPWDGSKLESGLATSIAGKWRSSSGSPFSMSTSVRGCPKRCRSAAGRSSASARPSIAPKALWPRLARRSASVATRRSTHRGRIASSCRRSRFFTIR